jgi:hypothetical protein
VTTKSRKLAVTGWIWKGRTARAKKRKRLLSLPWRKAGAFYGPVEYFSLSPAFFHIGGSAPVEPPDFVCMPRVEPPWVRHNLNEVDYLQKASLGCLMLQGRGGGGKMLSALRSCFPSAPFLPICSLTSDCRQQVWEDDGTQGWISEYQDYMFDSATHVWSQVWSVY